MKIFMIAGEPSGDRLGANLIEGLRLQLAQKGVEIVFQGIGGPLMKERGFISLFDIKDLAVMGFWEVLPKLNNILSIIKKISKYAVVWEPDVIITIDSPDFCFRVNKRIKKMWKNATIIHYVSPSVWAWRRNRAKNMATFVDHVLAILPFEPPYMHDVGLSCDFVGHPVVSQNVPSNQEIRSFRSYMNIQRDAPIVSILPGSRKSEITRMVPTLDKMVRVISIKYPNLVFVVPTTENVSDLVVEWVNKSKMPIKVISEKDLDPSVFEFQKKVLFSTSLAAVATSGTVSLELARMGAPMVIAYRASIFTELLYKLLMKVKTATLINILTSRMDIDEYLFRKCTFKNLSIGLNSILIDKDVVKRQIIASNEAMVLLGLGGEDPKIRAAKSVLDFMSKR